MALAGDSDQVAAIKEPALNPSEHLEYAGISTIFEKDTPSGNDNHSLHGFATNTDGLPTGYFTSIYFIGSYFAIGMNLQAAVGGFGYIAPVLTQIEAALGPSSGSQINWLALVYTLTVAIGLTLVGRLSDIFGRRWFFISGSLLGVIGSIVCATASSIPVCIGGETLIGFAAATGLSYPFAMAEIVPTKDRFAFGGLLYVFAIPASAFAPIISESFILNTAAGWRWCYYLLIITNGLTLVCYALFYYPPDFHSKHGNESKMLYVKRFDYIGTALYIAGLSLFIIGLNWGGTNYPWSDVHVIATIVVGSVCLIALFIYEFFATLEEPLIQMHLFRNYEYIADVVLLTLGASLYYAFAIVWPQMSVSVYGNSGPRASAWMACALTMGLNIGTVSGGTLGKMIGKSKWQCIVAITLGGIFFGAMATSTPETQSSAIALVILGGISIGWNEITSQIILTLTVKDQREIGAAVGIAGSFRSAISTVASAIYIGVLSNRAKKTVPEIVVPAVVKAGLPLTSIPGYFQAVQLGAAAAFASVKGITPAVIIAGAKAFQLAYADAYRTVFFTTIAFTGIGIISAFFVPNVETLMTNEVAITLQGRQGDEAATIQQRTDEEAVVEEKI